MISTMREGELGFINSEGQYKSLLKNSQFIGSAAMKIRGNTLYARLRIRYISKSMKTEDAYLLYKSLCIIRPFWAIYPTKFHRYIRTVL